MVFDRPGVWALQAEMAVPSNEYPCFYKTFEVTPARPEGRGDIDAPGVAAVVALVLGMSVLAVLVVVRVRSPAG